jgi:hypothetical protein
VVSDSLARLLAKRRTLADASDEPVAAPVRAKVASNMKPTAKIAVATAKTKPETRDFARAKPAALAAKTKPETRDPAKAKLKLAAADAAPKPKSAKAAVVATAKPDKRAIPSREIARAEPAATNKQPQKNAKRRI